MKACTILGNIALGILFTVLVWDVEIGRAFLLAVVVVLAHCDGYTSGLYKRFDN